MSRRQKQREQIWVVLRDDRDPGECGELEGRVVSTSAFRERADAEAEVERLRAVNEGKGAQYWCVMSRLVVAHGATQDSSSG